MHSAFKADETNFAPYAAGCETANDPAGDLVTGGMRGTLTPSGGAFGYGANASASLTVPGGTQLTGLSFNRAASGLVPGVEYSASALGNVLNGESASGVNVPAANKVVDVNPGATIGGSVLFKLICVPVSCPATAPATLDISRVGMKVAEPSDSAQAPSFAVGGSRSPAAGTLSLDVRANDSGVGLRWAEASLEGQPVVHKDFVASNCADMTPGDEVIDLPYLNDCAHVANLTLDVNTNTATTPDGNYTLLVRVADWAGHITEQRSPVEVANNINLGTNTQTLAIGTSGSTNQAANNNAANGGSGGVAGVSSQSCNTPRLSFSLSQKPMRVSNGVPVLQSGKRYRFNGRLTCVINGKRKSAPKRAAVEITNKIGSKTYTKAGTTVRESGKLTVILAYKTSRTITFRFTNTDGKRSTVSIKVKVEKKKTSKR